MELREDWDLFCFEFCVQYRKLIFSFLGRVSERNIDTRYLCLNVMCKWPQGISKF